MPSNTVYVGRPTKWGNPYTVTGVATLEMCLKVYRSWLRREVKNNPLFLEPLRGKDLACWCSLDKPCHADILLEMLK